ARGCVRRGAARRRIATADRTHPLPCPGRNHRQRARADDHRHGRYRRAAPSPVPAVVSALRYIVLAALAVSLLLTGAAQGQPQSGIVRPSTEPPTPSAKLGSMLY